MGQSLSLSFALSLVVLAVSESLCGADLPGAADDPPVGRLLESFPARWSQGSGEKRIEVAARLLALPAEETQRYLQTLFDPKTDPLFAPGALKRLSRERAAQLKRRRETLLMLLGQVNGRFGADVVDAATRTLTRRQQKEAATLLDDVCERVRPALFRRALKLPDMTLARVKMHKYVLLQIEQSEDLRLIDAIEPFLEIKASDRLWPLLRLLQNAAGQHGLMRKLLDARIAIETACRYAGKAGDAEYAAAAAIACIKETGEDAAARSAARGLAQLDTPEARDAVVKLLKDDATWKELRRALLQSLPGFFPEERIPFYVKAHGPGGELSGAGIAPWDFLGWLQEHDSGAGVDVARWRLAQKKGGWDEEIYLLHCRDKDTIRRMRAKARADEPRTLRSGIVKLIYAGVWEHLPEDLETRVATLAQDPELGASTRKVLLRDIGRDLVPEALPILRIIASDDALRFKASTLMLELGDRSVIPLLEVLLPLKRAAERIPAAAALYRAGDADQLEDLVAALKAAWLPAEVRVSAAKALSHSPVDLEPAAAAALAEALLDPAGRVSEAACEALCHMSDLTNVNFNPWADDATRRAQAGPLLRWVRSLE